MCGVFTERNYTYTFNASQRHEPSMTSAAIEILMVLVPTTLVGLVTVLAVVFREWLRRP